MAAVLAGEVGSFRNEEALKAMAVAARTYAAYFRSRHRIEGYDFCSTTHCQRAILEDAGGRFKKAAEATRGQLLWFHSKPAFAVYSQDCGGKSEAAHAVWPAAQRRTWLSTPIRTAADKQPGGVGMGDRGANLEQCVGASRHARPRSPQAGDHRKADSFGACAHAVADWRWRIESHQRKQLSVCSWQDAWLENSAQRSIYGRVFERKNQIPRTRPGKWRRLMSRRSRRDGSGRQDVPPDSEFLLSGRQRVGSRK